MLEVVEGEKAVDGLQVFAVAVGQGENARPVLRWRGCKLTVKLSVEDFLPAAPDIPEAGGAALAGVGVQGSGALFGKGLPGHGQKPGQDLFHRLYFSRRHPV